MRRIVPVIAALGSLLLAGCGASGLKAATPTTVAGTATSSAATVTAPAPSTTTTVARTTTVPVERLRAAMQAEVQRSCNTATASGAAPSIQYDPAWSSIGSKDSVTASVQACIDAFRAAHVTTTTATTAPPVTQAPATAAPLDPASCPNGTYVNSSGMTVCRPYASPSGPPAGATAICNDGTYSFSQHHQGSCSHHGGVKQFL